MRVIVTGGTGLIGRPLAAALADAGHEVIVLSRSPEKAAGLGQGIQVVRWDGRTAEGWGSLADGAGAIVNLAGESIAEGRWSDERKRRIRESRVNAGKAVVEAVQAARQKPAVLVQASAVGYYGPRGPETVTEDTPPGKDFLAQVCVDWEASTAPVEAMGVRRAIARTGIVLSADGGALPRMLLPFKFFAGGKLGSGQQGFPWIHIADEVAALRFLMENPAASGPFNLAAPNPPTNAEFMRAVGEAMGRPAAMPTPAAALRAVFGEMATVLLDGQRAAPKRLLDLGFQFRFTDPVAALRDLLRR
ncbi:MAG: TIGR01777 family oxidoreductase [Caldilineales bacterium]|nr:TIGR01777 family oxidoreductase [Caldilineales bacterium]MDW8318902.1 TIGR01777 family oxidoreductase [Anaerolineae bacterium]